jgi:hypothetical protein
MWYVVYTNFGVQTGWAGIALGLVYFQPFDWQNTPSKVWGIA